MAKYYFSHYEVNGKKFSQNPLSIQVASDITVAAIYSEEVPPEPVIPTWLKPAAIIVSSLIVVVSASKKKG